MVSIFLNAECTKYMISENTRPIMKNKIKDLSLNNGVIAIKKKISPIPIDELIGFTIFLLLIEV